MCAIVSSLLSNALHLGEIHSLRTFALYAAVLTAPSCMPIASPSVSGSSTPVVSRLFVSTFQWLHPPVVSSELRVLSSLSGNFGRIPAVLP